MSRRVWWLLAAAVVLYTPAARAAPAGRGGAGEYQRATVAFRFEDPEIVESSGLAVSSRRDDVVFTHNDSGDVPRFFAVNADGCTLARYAVSGAEARDWEDMTRASTATGEWVLFFGDIGDNALNRPVITVYRVPEPTPPRRAAADGPCEPPAELMVPASRFDLVYPDGPHDAEALMADPRSGRLFIVTKAYGNSSVAGVYATPAQLVADAVNLLDKVSDVHLPANTTPPSEPIDAVPFGASIGNQLVTGADIAPGGRRVVMRTYAAAYEWPVGGDGDLAAALAGPPARIDVPSQPQSEAITYARRCGALLVSSEDPLGTKPPVYRLEPKA